MEFFGVLKRIEFFGLLEESYCLFFSRNLERRRWLLNKIFGFLIYFTRDFIDEF
jgi:hypothetical protein